MKLDVSFVRGLLQEFDNHLLTHGEFELKLIRAVLDDMLETVESGAGYGMATSVCNSGPVVDKSVKLSVLYNPFAIHIRKLPREWKNCSKCGQPMEAEAAGDVCYTCD